MDAFADISGGPINAKDQGYREGYKAGQQDPSPAARAKIEAETLRRATKVALEHWPYDIPRLKDRPLGYYDGAYWHGREIAWAIRAMIPTEES